MCYIVHPLTFRLVIHSYLVALISDSGQGRVDRASVRGASEERYIYTMDSIALETLVRYDPPALVVTGHGKGLPPSRGVPTLSRGSALPPTEDVLAAILPPRTWQKDGKLWSQSASTVPATRMDLELLSSQLDLRMQQRHARETGIDPVREELYAQLFDELIRQETLRCAERGLLLLRVRNEAMQNIASYQDLYESSIAFGIRVALTAEQKQAEARARVRSRPPGN